MTDSVNGNTVNAKNDHLNGCSWEKFTDIHCHCLAGLDDGPATIEESIALCRKLVEQNIATVVATPHQLGRFEGCNETAEVKEAVSSLNETLRKSCVPLKVVPGGEVRVDERICQLLREDKILTLADGGRYILLELPLQVFIDIEPLLAELDSMGIRSVISHAEKIVPLTTQNQVLLRWLEHSTHLQITASSLVGDLGSKVERAAWGLLKSGFATLVATDSHNIIARRPQMKAAFGSITTKLGKDLANLVCIENPSRVVNGQEIAPVSFRNQQGVDR
jgi:protein-tyrosine phosphatase